MSKSLRIFSDFACPYCYIASALLKKLKKDIGISLIWVPMELHPEIPEEGLEIKKAYPDFDKESFDREMQKRAKPYGLNFSCGDMLVNSGRAIRAAEFARDASCFEDFHQAVFKALFEEKLNIADAEVLRAIAEKLNLDYKAMDKAIDEGVFESRLRTATIQAAEYNIHMAPSFVILGKTPLIGLPSEERLLSFIREAGIQ